MQTILGAGGAIGIDLAKSLPTYTDKIRLVSRNPKKVNPTDELFPADLSDREQLFKAIEGSSVVYVTVGFEYSIKVWEAKWPPFVKNVIDACKQYGAKLVFFDNIYMYDPNRLSNITEETPINPSSKKGKVRARIAKMITDEFGKGQLTALIARAADFYGPGIQNSVLVESVFKNLKKGKPADWFANPDKIHNFTYTPDAGHATAILGNTPDAYNQVWHMPTDHTKLSGRQWTALIAQEINAQAKVRALPVWLMGILGIFIPILKEFKEMAYQYDRDYFFNSSKFEKRFNFTPTTPEAGIKAVAASLE